MWPLHPDLVKLPPDSEERKRGYPDLPLYEGEKIVNPKITPDNQKRFTTEFTRRAVDFIARNKDRPFFLYLPHPMPHVPLFVSGRFRGKSAQGLYGDVIMEIDWSVGEILDALRRYGLDDNTLVIFTSDNGPSGLYVRESRRRNRAAARGQGNHLGRRRARPVHHALARQDSAGQRLRRAGHDDRRTAHRGAPDRGLRCRSTPSTAWISGR